MDDKEFAEVSKTRLFKILDTKLRTTFIGDLNAFEQEFSDLWRNDEKLRKIWQIIRKKILDNGNNTIRAVEKELRQYTVYWTGEHLDFRIKN